MRLLLVAFFFFTSTLTAEDAQKCAFCNPAVIEKQKVYESPNFWVITNYAPYNFGHLMIVPKKHVQVLDEMDPALGNELLCLYRKVSDVFSAVLNTRQTTVIEKNGIAAGQSVPHVHFHVIPMHESKWQTIANLQFFFRILFGISPESEEKQKEAVDLFRSHFKHLQ